MQVTIGIPYYDTIQPEVVGALLSGMVGLPYELHLSMVGGSIIAQNRETIVTEAIKAGSERLVFLDTDIVFPPDAIGRLLKHDHAIIGGLYHLKRLPLESAVKLPGQDGHFFTGRMTMPDEPIKAALLPAGFLSLHLPTLMAKLPRPWFPYGFENGEFIGEDTMFCRAAHAAGLELWCDPTIPLKHLGRYAY
jgi:hypothetical protein